MNILNLIACTETPPDTFECLEAFRDKDSFSREPQYVEVRIVDVIGENKDKTSRQIIDKAFQSLNDQYGPEFSFYLPQNGIQTYVNKSVYNDFVKYGESPDVPFRGQSLYSNAINIFIVPEYGSGDVAGECSNCLGDSINSGSAIILEKNISPYAWLHEIGHYGGLLHTWGDNQERVDGSNCSKSGDYICETPADAKESTCLVDEESCSVVECSTDKNGNEYRPDVRNIMSYYPHACRDHLYLEQLDVFSCVMRSFHGDVLREFPDSIIEPASTVLTVGCDEKSVGSIQEAINTIGNGGVVQICPGAYEENITINDSNLSLIATQGNVVIDGKQNGSVMIINDSLVQIDNISLANGSNDYGGGMQVINSDVELRNVSLYGNSALRGGALVAYHSSITATNLGLFLNQGEMDSGAFISDCSVNLKDVEISGNSSSNGILFFYESQDFELNGLLLEDNQLDDGSLTSVRYSSGSFSDVDYIDNQTSGNLIEFVGADVRIHNGSFSNNDVGESTLMIESSTVQWHGGQISDNENYVGVILSDSINESNFECSDVEYGLSLNSSQDVLILGDYNRVFDLQDREYYICSTTNEICKEY